MRRKISTNSCADWLCKLTASHAAEKAGRLNGSQRRQSPSSLGSLKVSVSEKQVEAKTGSTLALVLGAVV